MIEQKWSENVILVDADYVDNVAFDLIVNFERMIGRRIPQADMAKWLECVALDGGLRPSEGSSATIQVVLLHQKQEMGNFLPGNYSELDGKAFTGQLGEFLISCVSVNDMVTMDELFIESTQVLSNAEEVKTIIAVPNAEQLYNRVRAILCQTRDGKHATILTMLPMEGGLNCKHHENFRQEILGYSLMAALGIHSEELVGAR